jgi:hypothetical protein
MPNIKLKNKNGIEVIYTGILSVTFDTDDGGKATFVYVSQNTNTTAKFDENNVLVLNNAEINKENVLELDGASIDEQGYLIIEKEVE